MTIGVTGNIGSGKSTVCKVFQVLGIPSFHADDEAKEFYRLESGRKAVRDKLGPEVFDGDVVNLKKVASVVFNDKKLLEWLNGQIHPFVRNRFEEWKRGFKKAPYVIYEAAILFETGRYRDLDMMITVTAPRELRYERVVQRDAISIEEAGNREKNQWPQEDKEKLSDFVIINDEKHLVVPQVVEIHRQIINSK
jgi:dephospho-CoA kinase